MPVFVPRVFTCSSMSSSTRPTLMQETRPWHLSAYRRLNMRASVWLQHSVASPRVIKHLTNGQCEVWQSMSQTSCFSGHVVPFTPDLLVNTKCILLAGLAWTCKANTNSWASTITSLTVSTDLLQCIHVTSSLRHPIFYYTTQHRNGLWHQLSYSLYNQSWWEGSLWI